MRDVFDWQTQRHGDLQPSSENIVNHLAASMVYLREKWENFVKGAPHQTTGTGIPKATRRCSINNICIVRDTHFYVDVEKLLVGNKCAKAKRSRAREEAFWKGSPIVSEFGASHCA